MGVFLRILTVIELKWIHGFSITYKLIDNPAVMKVHIGNSVEVTTAKHFALSLAEGVMTGKIETQINKKQFKLKFA